MGYGSRPAPPAASDHRPPNAGQASTLPAAGHQPLDEALPVRGAGELRHAEQNYIIARLDRIERGQELGPMRKSGLKAGAIAGVAILVGEMLEPDDIMVRAFHPRIWPQGLDGSAALMPQIAHHAAQGRFGCRFSALYGPSPCGSGMSRWRRSCDGRGYAHCRRGRQTSDHGSDGRR